MMHSEVRSHVLFSAGASVAVANELLAFNAAPQVVKTASTLRFDLFVDTWSRFVERTKHQPTLDILRKVMPQLSFPIADDVGETKAYKQAVQNGRWKVSVDALPFEQPDALQLYLHDSLVGPIPILQTANRADFVKLTQAIAYRNRPNLVPDSMGASLITGYTNWWRINQLQEAWVAEHGIAGLATWPKELAENVVPYRRLYQDTFLILSEGAYSGVSAETLGLASDRWREISVQLRREHECAHYYLLQQRQSSQHNALDELIADFHAIRLTTGRFHADWLLAFLGLEDPEHYRSGGRLENYRETLSEDAFDVLCQLVRRAVARLQELDTRIPDYTIAKQKQLLNTLSQITLEEFLR